MKLPIYLEDHDYFYKVISREKCVTVINNDFHYTIDVIQYSRVTCVGWSHRNHYKKITKKTFEAKFKEVQERLNKEVLESTEI